MTARGGEERTAAARVRRLGAFEIDLRSEELRKNGVVVPLPPQPFNLLVLLTSRPGEVVTREEMRQALWPDGTVVGCEQALSSCVRQIRLALNDSAQAPRFIETLPKRGYRWVWGPTEVPADAVPAGQRPLQAPAPGGETRGTPPAEPPAGWVLNRRGRWIVATLVVATLASIGSAFLRRPARSSTEHFQRVTFRRGFLTGARFGPDGRVVYAASWDGRPVGVYETRADAPGSRSLELGAFRLAGVSPSGEVAFIRDGVLARAPLAGGPPKEVATDVRAADWTDDGSAFAVARALKEGYRLEYPIGRPVGRAPDVGALRISPDGRYLAFAEHPIVADDRGSVVILDQAGNRLATSTTFGSLEGLAWSPQGDEVWFTAVSVGVKNALRAVGIDGHERLLLGSMGRLVLHDVAADGRLLISRSNLRAEVFFQRAGEPEVVDLSWLDTSSVAALSPDGATILFFEGGDGGGPDYTTFLRRTDGSPPVRLGNGRAVDLSPDGRWALVIPVTRPDHVALVPTEAGETREIRGPGGMVMHDAAGWLSDGQTLFVTGRDAANRGTSWLMDQTGGNPRRLPLPEGRHLTWSTFSPDDTLFVAPCPIPDAHPCLYDVEGGNPRRIPGTEEAWEAIGWDEHGRVLFLDRPGVGAPVRLRRVDPATGSVDLLAQLDTRDPAGVLSVYRLFVTPDASAWAYTVIRRQSDLFIATGID